MSQSLPEPSQTPVAASRWTVQRLTMIGAGAVIALIVLIFLIGVGLALFSNAELAAPRVQIIRDIFIIILALQGILIVGSLAVLIVQLARLINLLQNEVMPILKNTQDTINTARGTVEFVGTNLTEPVIRLNGFLAAIMVLLRELFGIRRALRKEPASITEDNHEPS